jgi:hypothetical protein
MKNIKKNLTIFGAVVLAFLLISTVTVVSKTNDEIVLNQIEREVEFEQLKECIDSLVITFEENNPPEWAEEEGELQSETIPLIDIDEIIEYLDIEGFIDFFTGEKFVNFMKNDLVKSVIESDVFFELYNLDEIQEFVNSEEFQDLYETEEVQDFLGQLAGTYTELLGMVIFFGSLILGMIIWYSTAGLVSGILGVGLSILILLGLIPLWQIEYQYYLDKISTFTDYIFGPFDELYPIVGYIAQFLSATGALFLGAMAALSTAIQHLIINLILYCVAILPPILFAFALLAIYIRIVDGFGLLEFSQTNESEFAVCQTYLTMYQNLVLENQVFQSLQGS